jgi:hypothetical protein
MQPPEKPSIPPQELMGASVPEWQVDTKKNRRCRFRGNDGKHGRQRILHEAAKSQNRRITDYLSITAQLGLGKAGEHYQA